MKQWNLIEWFKRFLSSGWYKLWGYPRVERVGRLSSLTYSLNSPELDISPDIGDTVQELHRDAYERFQAGELFLQLKPITEAGGMVTALISESGKPSRNHLLAAYPPLIEQAGTIPRTASTLPSSSDDESCKSPWTLLQRRRRNDRDPHLEQGPDPE